VWEGVAVRLLPIPMGAFFDLDIDSSFLI
jgi:hypothetical protein